VSQWDPDSYGQINTLQQLVAERALADLVLEGGERVLDVGCGDGKVTAMIAARLTTGTVVGVDPSPKMIDAARLLLPDRRRSTFLVGTAATLTFNASFDVATSFNALHWEIRSLEALERIRSALRPNGRALLVFVCDGERPSLEDVVMRTCQSSRWQSAFDDFAAPFVHVDPDVYAVAADSAGFAVERLMVDDLEWDFGTRAAFTGWCAAGLVAWTGRLAPDDRADFVYDVISGYAEVSGSESMFRFLQCRIRLTAT
jgi:trans-aconitate 2-methyltransferase